MKQKVKRLLTIFAGIWLLVLIACSIIIFLFFPGLLYPASETQSKAPKEPYAKDFYAAIIPYDRDLETAIVRVESIEGAITKNCMKLH